MKYIVSNAFLLGTPKSSHPNHYAYRNLYVDMRQFVLLIILFNGYLPKLHILQMRLEQYRRD